MFERFTDSCRKVMALANQQAQRYNHEYIGTEHILLGLAREKEGVGAQVLQSLEVDIDSLRIEVEKFVKVGPEKVRIGKLPQTPRAKNVIEWAIDEARALEQRDIGTEHLLLGLLQVKDGVACQVLNSFGITYDKARSEILRLLEGGFTDMKNVLRKRTKQSQNEECSEKTNKNNIQVLEVTGEFTVCPQCDYEGGFHSIFYNLNSDKPTRWILMCPSCKAKYDIGLKYPE